MVNKWVRFNRNQASDSARLICVGNKFNEYKIKYLTPRCSINVISSVDLQQMQLKASGENKFAASRMVNGDHKYGFCHVTKRIVTILSHPNDLRVYSEDTKTEYRKIVWL